MVEEKEEKGSYSGKIWARMNTKNVNETVHPPIPLAIHVCDGRARGANIHGEISQRLTKYGEIPDMNERLESL